MIIFLKTACFNGKSHYLCPRKLKTRPPSPSSRRSDPYKGREGDAPKIRKRFGTNNRLPRPSLTAMSSGLRVGWGDRFRVREPAERPPGGEKCGFRCRKVPFYPYVILPCALGRRKRSKVSPKRGVLHSRATESVDFVAEDPPSSLRHSALRPWATETLESVAQTWRAAPLGDEKVLKCRPNVACRTLG